MPGRAAALALLGLVLSFGASGVGGLVADLALGSLLITVVVAQALLWAGMVATVWVASRRYGTGKPLADFGFRFNRLDPLTGVGASLAMRIAAGVVIVAISQAMDGTDELPDQLGFAADERRVLLVFMALAVVGAPVVEELFFRGLLQRSLQGVVGVPVALVVQAVVFGLVHALPTGTATQNLVLAGGLTAAGLVLGATVHASGRLGPAVWAHVWFNAASMLIVALSW